MSNRGIAIILVAAGRGERLGSNVPKALAVLAGETLLAHSVRTALLARGLKQLVVAGPETHIEDFAEIVRAGMQAVPRGQWQAGMALGLGPVQNLRLVILPQAMRNMLPVLLTQVIVLFQDTSLVYAIGAYDMLKGFDVAGKILGRPIEAYIGAAVVYFVLCLLLSRLAARLQRKVAILR